MEIIGSNGQIKLNISGNNNFNSAVTANNKSDIKSNIRSNGATMTGNLTNLGENIKHTIIVNKEELTDTTVYYSNL